MTITIRLDGNDASIELRNADAAVVDAMSWQANHQLSDQILSHIDALLAKHALQAQAISHVDAQVSETAGVTAARVVHTIAHAWTAGVRYS